MTTVLLCFGSPVIPYQLGNDLKRRQKIPFFCWLCCQIHQKKPHTQPVWLISEMLHLLLLYLQLGLHLNTAMSSFHIFLQRCFTEMNYKFHTLWKGFICARHISGPTFSGHCYKPIIWAQALRNLYFVSLPEDGARKLRVDAAVWGKPPCPPAHAQTLLLLKSHPEMMQVAQSGERRCRGVQGLVGRRLIFLFSAAQPSAACQRGSRDMSFICSPVADFVQTRTRPWTSQCPCVCWGDTFRNLGC